MVLVSRASRIFLYFRWEEREREKNTSGHSGQLPVDIRTNAKSAISVHACSESVSARGGAHWFE